MGALASFIHYNFPPKSKWSVDDIPDLSGKVIIVTGGNSGIGKETVKALLTHKAKVYILSRDAAKATSAISELKSLTGQDVHYIQVDLADLKSVKKAAEEFKRKESSLNVLINNAGVMMPKPKSITSDGYDYQFGINVLGHYYLTTLLHEALRAASSGPGAEPARIVNLSSAGHILCKEINWSTLKDGEERQKTSMSDLYNQSKLGNLMLASEFAKRYGGENITSSAIHPGLIATDLARDMPQPVVKFLQLFFYTADKGALTSLYAATAPENANANGKYFVAWARTAEPASQALDPESGKKLWDWCEEQVRTVVG